MMDQKSQANQGTKKKMRQQGHSPRKHKDKGHRRTGTFGLGGRGGGGGRDLFARKNYTMPKCVSVEIER